MPGMNLNEPDHHQSLSPLVVHDGQRRSQKWVNKTILDMRREISCLPRQGLALFFQHTLEITGL